MDIEDEVRKTREKMLDEKRKAEEAAAIKKRLDNAFSDAGMSEYSPKVVMPNPSVQAVIQEAMPSLKFTSPKIVRTMPNGITYMRDTRDKERPTEKTFDVEYERHSQDKSTYVTTVSIFRNGSIAINGGGTNVQDMDAQVLRTKIIEKLASDSIKKGSSGSSSSSSGSGGGGCYVATAVYGSYDCPQVWVLRRYRDYVLMENPLGRAFVRLYYAVSPTLVRLFGKTRWFSGMLRPILNKKVDALKEKGYKDKEYQDRV